MPAGSNTPSDSEAHPGLGEIAPRTQNHSAGQARPVTGRPKWADRKPNPTTLRSGPAGCSGYIATTPLNRLQPPPRYSSSRRGMMGRAPITNRKAGGAPHPIRKTHKVLPAPGTEARGAGCGGATAEGVARAVEEPRASTRSPRRRLSAHLRMV